MFLQGTLRLEFVFGFILGKEKESGVAFVEETGLEECKHADQKRFRPSVSR